MKILVIEGAKKNGNTSRITDQLISGLNENNHAIERVNLFTLKNIHGCLDCGTCRKNGGNCIWKDDITPVLKKMLEADLIVMTSPVYWYSITAQLKMIIDRSFSIMNQLKNKKMIFITTSAAPHTEAYAKDLDIALDTYLGYIKCFHGEVENIGIIGGYGTAMNEDLTQNKAYKQAYELGKEIK